MKYTHSTNTSTPVYEQLREYLTRDIESGKLLPGDRISPENQLADRFHVSRTTIRRALHGLEQEGMILRFPGKGTFINSSPHNPFSEEFTIGINFLTGVSSDFFHAKIAEGVLEQAAKYDINVQMLPRSGEADPEISDHISGVLFVGMLDKNTLLYKKISKGLIPAVGFNNRVSNACSYIGINDEKEVCNAVSDLIAKGYRSVGYFGSEPSQVGGVAYRRYKGYCKALANHGLPLIQENIHFHNNEQNKQYQALEFLRKSAKNMDSIFVSLSPVLPDLLYAMNVLHLSILEDLKILCFDNLYDRFLDWPGISYISMPLKEIGIRMLTVLRQHLILREKAPVIHEIFPAQLVHCSEIKI